MQAAEPLAEDWGNHNIMHLHPAAWARAVLCIGGEGILPCVLYQAVHPGGKYSRTSIISTQGQLVYFE